MSGTPGPTGPRGPPGPPGPISTIIADSRQVYRRCINSVVIISIIDNANNVYVGSGFFVAIPSTKYNPFQYGYIATAAHVILDPNTNEVANNIWIHTASPTVSSIKINGSNAVVMGVDKNADIALLRISGTTYRSLHLSIRDSRSGISIGQTISIIGFPRGDDAQSITRGIIRDNKYQSNYALETVFTDASIFGGNSGGPMVIDDGTVVGILSWGISDTDSLNGGIASYVFRPILTYFCNNYVSSTVSYPKGYLGINYSYVSFMAPMVYSNLKMEGVVVTGFDNIITPKFNLNDIIIKVNNVHIGNLNNQFPLSTEIHLRSPGTSVVVSYRPYNAGTNTYGVETTKTVVLEPINPAKDIFLYNNVRQPMKVAANQIGFGDLSS